MPSSAPEIARHIAALQGLLHSANGGAETPAAAQELLDELCRGAKGMVDALPVPAPDELKYWARTLSRQCRRFRDELRALVPEPSRFSSMPSLETATKAAVVERRYRAIDELVARCQELSAMDFEPLYDSSRHLLSIGYDMGERRRDPSWYDLLASEARLTSYLLVAEGQVPQKHWFALGRLLTSHGGDLSLMSWSGSMFEYLLPQLFLPGYENTLLEQACQAAVSRQIEYGRERHVPWGISESCYNAVDMNQVYQYRGFGVPGLGFKAGLADDLVIAPYATALALTVVPREACRNLQTLSGSRFSRCVWTLRGDRLHALASAPRHEPRRRTLLHGASPGDEPAGHRARVARSAHPAPVQLQPAGPDGRTAAAGTYPQTDRDRATARG